MKNSCYGWLVLLELIAGGRAFAEDVSFAWEQNPDPVAGYYLYYGMAPRGYSEKIDVGTNLTATVSNLIDGVTYYFALTSYSSDGIESDPSGEVVYPPLPKIAAAVALANLHQLYDGTPKTVTAFTSPSGLAVDLTYNGSSEAPTDIGTYEVVGTIDDANYAGSITNTLVIGVGAIISLENLYQSYNGSARSVTVTTTPLGLPVSLTYNGSTDPPTEAGFYTVTATVDAPQYFAVVTDLLVIYPKIMAWVSLADLYQVYDGTAKTATVFTFPGDLPVNVTYNGSSSAPTNAGIYQVVATIEDTNYFGSTTDTLIIAGATIELANRYQVYDGKAHSVTATTTPAGLSVSLSYNGSTEPPTNAGFYTVVATVDDPQYFATVTDWLFVDAAELTITGDDKIRGYGEPDPPFTGTMTGVAEGDNLTATFTSYTTWTLVSGAYPIWAEVDDPEGKLSNYWINQINGTLTITPLPLKLSIGCITVSTNSEGQELTQPVNAHRVFGRAEAGRAYPIFGSVNLIDWSFINYVFVGDDGNFEFIDMESDQYPVRFFRAYLQ